MSSPARRPLRSVAAASARATAPLRVPAVVCELLLLSGLVGCRTTNLTPEPRLSWSEAGLTEAPRNIARPNLEPLDRSTEALLAAIERATGERPVVDGDGVDLSSDSDAVPVPSDATGWTTERRVLAMDVLRLSGEHRSSLSRAREALRWDVSVGAHWSDVDARLVSEALARADALLGPTAAELAAKKAADEAWPVEPFQWPVSPVRVTSRFGVRQDPLGEGLRRHTGLDLTAFEGQPVSSAAAGRVIYAGRRGSYGLHVEVAHQNGYTTRYAHLSAVLVEWGQRVSAGSLIGRAGQTGRATGPHLHFELWQNGLPIDPFDAMPEPQHGREAPADRRHLSMR